MNNEEDNLDLLDLDDDTPVETLPETTPFAAPRPRKPWLLMGLGVIVIILATYIIVRTIGSDSSQTMEINLDTPEVVVGDSVDVSNDTLNVPVKPVPVPVQRPVPQPQPQPRPMPAPQPVAQPQPVPQPVPVSQPQPQPQPMPVAETGGVPVRVVADRRDVTFNPDKPVVAQPKPVEKPVAQPAPKPVAKPAVQKTATTPRGAWYVQFGSYSSRALAESAERQMRSGHASLFAGKQPVILAAQLPNGKTTYRLRVAFDTSKDANGFCQNAKSDGLDCYVAK